MFHYHYRFIQSVSGPPHVQTRTAGQHWQSGSMLVEQGVGCSWHCCKYGNCWVLEFCYSVMVCLMYWYNYCQQGFFQIIGLGTFHLKKVCIKEIPCFKWNYNVNLDVVHESETKTQICYFLGNSSKTFMFSIFIRLNETWRFQKYFEFFIFMKKVDPSSKKL